jgi:hypothetical protein
MKISTIGQSTKVELKSTRGPTFNIFKPIFSIVVFKWFTFHIEVPEVLFSVPSVVVDTFLIALL